MANSGGYSDITICTPEKVGVIIELKYQEDGDLEKGCKDALEQIENRKYDETLKRRRMKTIIKYGIAFWQKECMVVMGDEVLQRYGIAAPTISIKQD